MITVTISVAGDDLHAETKADVPAERDHAFRVGLDLFMGTLAEQAPVKVSWSEAAAFLVKFVADQGEAVMTSQGIPP
jgi:hypothetical protein